MKKKVIRLTEKDIESLVEKIIREGEEDVSSSDLGKSTVNTGKELKKGGLAPKERETLDDAITMLTAFFKQPGNQATGKAYNLFNKLKDELTRVKPEDVNESIPRRERERQATNFRRQDFKPYDREGQLMDVFGPYKNDVPPNVIQYMRKNPSTFIKKLADVYGKDKILRYLGE